MTTPHRLPFKRSAARAATASAFLIVAGFALSACSSADDATESGGLGGVYLEEGQMDMMVEEQAAVAEDQARPAEDGAATQYDVADRSVIVTGSMSITVEDPVAMAEKATSIVETVGGRIDSRQESAPTEYSNGSTYLTLRVPSSALDGTIAQLRELGEVSDLSIDSFDVTTTVQDLDIQISILRESTTRIQELLGQAEEISDIIALETELGSRQAQLESLEAYQRGLDDQVSMSTIYLGLYTDAPESKQAPDTFLGGLQVGWDALVAFFAGSIVLLGVLLPWLAIAAIVAVAAWVTVRVVRGRQAS